MNALEHKAMTVKALSQEGEVEAIISTFGRDRDGDVMTREAFQGSEGKSIPMVWSHNWDQPIGKGVVSVTSDGAVFKGQFFLETTAGQDAYKTVKAMGDLQEYSIGFQIRDADKGYQEVEGKQVFTRTIKDIELFEASPVLVGAAFNTGTIAVKEAKADMHEQLKALKEAHDSSCDLGADCPFAEKHVVEEDELIKRIRDFDAEIGYPSLIGKKKGLK